MTKILALVLILFIATPAIGIAGNYKQTLMKNEIRENFKSISKAGDSYNSALILGLLSIGAGIATVYIDDKTLCSLSSVLSISFGVSSLGVSIMGNNHLRHVSYTKSYYRDY